MSHAADGHAGHGPTAHGHTAAGHEPHAHGGEIPPAPLERHITPAPEDFQNLPGARALVVPILWCALAGLLVAVLLSGGWGLHGTHGNDAHAAHPAFRAPRVTRPTIPRFRRDQCRA